MSPRAVKRIARRSRPSPGHRFSIRRIISGGQTGADRGALEAALALGIPHGGWCPKGRRAEDGRIPKRYSLRETSSTEYPVRTKRNVVDSDATLLFRSGPLRGGSALTARLAREHGRPLLMASAGQKVRIRTWLEKVKPRVLNVAGPRESEAPGLERRVRDTLVALLRDELPERG